MGSGTIKTLAALLAALTVGTVVLMLMETAPARPIIPLPPLQALRADGTEAAVQFIEPAEAKLQGQKWRNIVIHDSSHDSADTILGCHFLIGNTNYGGDGSIEATRLWRRQEDGRHVFVPAHDYNANTIGICVLVDGGVAGMTPAQRASLVSLIRALQLALQIQPDHVYTHGQLGGANCPGKFITDDDFRDQLLAGSR
jgi:hypothetical protein